MRQLTQSAQAAKMIRSELKKAFPGVKFSVTSDNYSMGDAVRIKWTDGVTVNQVDAIAGKYQYGSFDGMTDCYDFTNTRNDLPQTKFVMTSRDFSEDATRSHFDQVKAKYADFREVTDIDQTSEELLKRFGSWTARSFVRASLHEKDLRA